MIREDVNVEIVEIEVPLQESLVDELVDFWQAIFKTSYEDFRSVLTGAECAQNRDIIYLARKGKQLAGTCHLTISKSGACLGGLGEVAVASEFRRRGIASTLCTRAHDTFCEKGGQALFLGTVNPAAARVYRRLGWRKLAGANVMVFITNGNSPEAFLVDYFREQGPVTIAPGTAFDRIPIIPLLISPHDWQVLDANVSMFSTRYVVQNSCMFLYPRYEALLRDGRGAWFGARTYQGRLVGLSTVRLSKSDIAKVDGFAHQNSLGCWKDLIQAAVRWAAERSVPLCGAYISVEDEDKQSLFESLGFRKVGTGDFFNLDGRRVGSVRLEKASPERMS